MLRLCSQNSFQQLLGRKVFHTASVLVPHAKELASILEGNCTVEELEQYKAMLSNCIKKKKHEIMAQRGSANGSMVSSSVCSNRS